MHHRFHFFRGNIQLQIKMFNLKKKFILIVVSNCSLSSSSSSVQSPFKIRREKRWWKGDPAVYIQSASTLSSASHGVLDVQYLQIESISDQNQVFQVQNQILMFKVQGNHAIVQFQPTNGISIACFSTFSFATWVVNERHGLFHVQVPDFADLALSSADRLALIGHLSVPLESF